MKEVPEPASSSLAPLFWARRERSMTNPGNHPSDPGPQELTGSASTFVSRSGIPPPQTTARPPLWDETPEQIGRYRILRALGQGGRGSVSLPRDTQLDREVALKVPRLEAGTSQNTLERFLREARAAAALDHPN